MAFPTRATARQQIGRLLGGYYSGTTNASGSTTTSTADTDMGAYKNDWFNGKWIYFSAAGNERLIDDWVNSTVTFSWTGALTAPDALAYEIHPYAPSVIHSALDNAIDDSFPYYARTVRDYFVGGSPLINPFFQEWTSSSAAKGWSMSGTGTVSRITADAVTTPTPPMPLFGIYALKLVNTVSNAAAMWQHVGPGYDGKSIKVYALVHAVVSGRVSAAITDDDGTTNSSNHGGTGWEILTCTRTVNLTGGDSNKPTAEVQIATGSAINIYIAAIWTDAGVTPAVHRLSDMIAQPAAVYRLGAMSTTTDQILDNVFPRIPGRVRIPASWSPISMSAENADARYNAIRLNAPRSGCIYEVHGFAPLSKPSADTDYIELEPEDAGGLWAYAAHKVLSMLPAPQQTPGVIARMNQLKKEYIEALARRGNPLYSN